MSARDQHGTPPFDHRPSHEDEPTRAEPLGPEEVHDGPPVAARHGDGDASADRVREAAPEHLAAPAQDGSPDQGDEAIDPRPSAPILSLEARKAHRQRQREAMRAARIAAVVVSEEDEDGYSPRSGTRPAAMPAAMPAAGPTPARDLAPESGGRLRSVGRADLRAVARARRQREAAAQGGGEQALHGVGPGDGSTDASPGPASRRLGGVRPDHSLFAVGRHAAGPPRVGLGPAAADEGPAAAPVARRGRAAIPEHESDQTAPFGPALQPFPGSLRQPAAAARIHFRHWLVVASFALLVLLPTALTAWYVWTLASPRYASYAGFSVRNEDTASAMGILSGVAALAGGSSSSDTDILYEFIRSQEIVEQVDRRLDLEAMWSKGDPARDPVFAYHAPGTIEDLHDYWNRMVEVYNDGNTGLLDIEVQAFTAEDATAVATAIYEESTALINRLSDIAQADATRYAEEELATAVERLKVARAALTQFRNETQIVDPATAVASQMGLLSELESQLAQTLIDLDLLRQTAPDGDPRVAQSEARVRVIEQRMEAERAKLGLGPVGTLGAAPPGGEGEATDGGAFADLVGRYEGLAVDQEFASQAYTAALVAYDAALGESRRQSRYLAAHVQPTLAQRAEFPNRITLTALTFLFALLAWIILTLAGYALRDRR